MYIHMKYSDSYTNYPFSIYTPLQDRKISGDITIRTGGLLVGSKSYHVSIANYCIDGHTEF